MTNTRTFTSWVQMRSRCRNPKDPYFHRYGGRGIRVCKRWMRFENFVIDMGIRPSGKSLDRIDNEKNYSKTNCRWSTPREQASNKSTNRRISFNGETMILKDWARKLGIDNSTLWARVVKLKWPIDRAFTQIPLCTTSSLINPIAETWAKIFTHNIFPGIGGRTAKKSGDSSCPG